MRVKECKALARETLIGRYGILIAAYFITLLVSVVIFAASAACFIFAVYHAGLLNKDFGFNAVFSLPLISLGVVAGLALFVFSWIVYWWFEIGRKKLMINICRGRVYGLGDIFYAFKSGSHPWNYILTGIILIFIPFLTGGIGTAAALLITLLMKDTAWCVVIIALVRILIAVISAYIMVSFMLAKIIVVDRPDIDALSAFGRSGKLMKGRRLKGFWLMYFSFLFWNLLIAVCSFAALWVLPYIECTNVIFYLDAEGSTWQIPGAKTKSEPAPEPAPEPAQEPAVEPEPAPEPAAEPVPEPIPEAGAEPALAEADTISEEPENTEPVNTEPEQESQT